VLVILLALLRCTIKDNTATFVTDNQAIIFRAQKQNTVLLSAIKQVKSLTHIEKVVIKIIALLQVC
jgi:hypothetical protein